MKGRRRYASSSIEQRNLPRMFTSFIINHSLGKKIGKFSIACFRKEFLLKKITKAGEKTGDSSLFEPRGRVDVERNVNFSIMNEYYPKLLYRIILNNVRG